MNKKKSPRRSEEQNLKTVPKKLFVHVDIDEEITAIFERMAKSKISDFFLVIPNRALVSQTEVNFKILKKKVEDMGKNLAIVTRDPSAMKLASQAGIPVYESVANEVGTTGIINDSEEDDGPAIAPIVASSNEFEESGPRRIARKKMSIAEILNMKREIVNRKSPEKNRLPAKIKSLPDNENREETNFTDLRPSKRTIMTLIGTGLLLFLIIGYIALPGATIAITPKAAVLSSSINIVFADAKKNASLLKSKDKNAVSTYPLAKTVTFQGNYASTGKNFKGANATGRIKIFNAENRDWPLVTRTRFQTTDGLVFRITKDITVPKANGNVAGTVEADVEADPLDIYEKVVGERGNIGPSKFFLPALRESSRESLYALNEQSFSGGSTASTPFVLAEDLVAAKQFVIEELKKKVLVEMMTEVDSYNAVNQVKFSLLTGEGALAYGDARVTVPQELVGKEVQEIPVSGEIPVRGVMYDHAEFLDLLKQNLAKSQSPDKKIVKIEDSSLQYKIFESDQAGAILKATATIKAIEEYAIDPQSEAGINLLRKIKERVVDLPLEEAKNRVQNLPEVHTAEIETWPLWAPRMPKVPENIEVKILPNQ